MQVQVNFSSLSLAQLKQAAVELNAKVEGDRRLRETWIRACELASQAAIVVGESVKNAAQQVGQSVDELAGAEVVASLSTTVQAVGEAYSIAHAQFVVPTERAISTAWNFATSEQTIRLYLNAALSVMRFCFALVRAGMIARELVDEFVAECQEVELPEGMEPTVARVMVARYFATKSAIGRRVWALDNAYQVKVVEPVKQEVMAVFALGEWLTGINCDRCLRR